MKVLDAFITKVALQIINPIIMLLAGAAFVVFVWGVFQFIAHGGDETKRKEGREAIFWGLVGLVIIFGVYGLLNVVLTSFSLPSVTK